MEDSGLLIYPTDTVWGIGGSIYSQESYKKIALIKKTSIDKPLSLLFPNIEQIFDFFKLEGLLDREWLETFFSFGSSLGLPISLANKKLPPWSYSKSNFIVIRCLDCDFIAKAFETYGGPLTSTSLNQTGEQPITSHDNAKTFFEKYCCEETFIEPTLETNLSGESSTIIVVQGEKLEQIKVLRAGLNLDKIKDHLELPIS